MQHVLKILFLCIQCTNIKWLKELQCHAKYNGTCVLTLVILNALNILISRKKVETDTSHSMFIHVHVSCCHFLFQGTTTSSPGISEALATASSGLKAGRFLGTPTPNLSNGGAKLCWIFDSTGRYWESKENLSLCCGESWKFCRDDGWLILFLLGQSPKESDRFNRY